MSEFRGKLLLIGVFLSVGLLTGLTVRSLDSPPPLCACKAEACPAAPECPVPAPACPLQPTLEVRKPLSEEMDAVVAKYKPGIERALSILDEMVVNVHDAMVDARRKGVSTIKFDWLENAEARAAATYLWGAHRAVDDAVYTAYDLIHKCREELKGLSQSTDAWAWIEGEPIEDSLASARGQEQEYYEFLGYEGEASARCNVVMNRLECPLPKPPEVP